MPEIAMPTAPTPPARQHYSPRSAAAEFTKALPALNVDATPPPPDPAPPVEKPAVVPPETATPPATAVQSTPPTPAPEEKMPRTAKDWDAFRAANKKRIEEKESELAKVNARIAELEKAPKPNATGDDPRVVELQQQADELSERLRLVDITNHPRFKTYYDQKIGAQVEMAKKIVGADNAEAIASLLKLPDNEYRQARLEEIVTTLSPIAQSRIGGVLNQLQEIEMDKENQIQLAKTDFTASQEKARKDAESARATNIQKAESAFSTVVSTLQNPKDKDSLFIFQKRDGDEEWNKGVDDRLKSAKDLLFGQQPPEQLMRAALHAAALPAMVSRYHEAQDKIKALEDQVAGLTAAQPRSSSGGGGPEGAEKPAGQPPAKKSNFLDGRGQAAGWIKDIASTMTQE
jgi:hypothetical protein